MSVFDQIVTDVNGNEQGLDAYRGRVCLIANVASGCGFAPQMRDLEALRRRFADRGFEVLAFPSNDFNQEKGRGEALVSQACARYDVSFPIFNLTHVRGKDRHPLFGALTGGGFAAGVLWNFEKFLVGRDGRVVARWRSLTSPLSGRVVRAIETALAAAP